MDESKFDEIFERTLIVAPHCDDETIGCGGLIAKIASKDINEVLILIVATSNTFSYNANRTVRNHERLSESRSALSVLGVNPDKGLRQLSSQKCKFLDGQLDMIPRKDLVTHLDQVIQEFVPTAVLFPYPSHHQDHQVVHDACISALRPTPYTNFIRLKAMYEYTYAPCWGQPPSTNSKLYVELDNKSVALKKQALECYSSQLQRDPRDLLDVDAVIDLAKLRGREIGVEYAEAYYPLSIVF